MNQEQGEGRRTPVEGDGIVASGGHTFPVSLETDDEGCRHYIVPDEDPNITIWIDEGDGPGTWTLAPYIDPRRPIDPSHGRRAAHALLAACDLTDRLNGADGGTLAPT